MNFINNIVHVFYIKKRRDVVMIKTYAKYFMIFLFLLFIASCTKTIDKKEKIAKSIPKDRKQANQVEKFGAWIFAKEGKSCYIYSFPVSSYGFYLDRKLHYMQINDKKEMMVLGGLSFKPESKVRIDVGTYSFFLETTEDKAWANNEDFIINIFLDNKDSILFVYNEFLPEGEKDQSAVDKYTLQGFLEAWEYMSINCNVEPLEKQKLSHG